MKNGVIPLAALAASTTILDMKNHDDPLDEAGYVRAFGAKHRPKSNSAFGGIKGSD